MKISIKIDGVKEVLDGLNKAAIKYPEATGAALFEEGEAIKAASIQLVPVDTGRLRSTAYTSPPREGSHGPEVKVSYGTKYAVPVHERMESHHTVGQAKYLEQPATAAMAGFAGRLAKRIAQHVKAGTDFAILKGDS